jgi:hypothetical protein
MMKLRAYRVWQLEGEWPLVIVAKTAGQAKYKYLVSSDLPCSDFRYLRCKALGVVTRNMEGLFTQGFRRTAEYRGVPFAYIGMEVMCDRRRGVLVGHNSSANFDVCFYDTGTTLNCHPNWRMRYLNENGETVCEYRDGVRTEEGR